MILTALAAGGLPAAAQTETNAPATNVSVAIASSTSAPAASTNADQSAAPVALTPPATNAPIIVEKSDAEDLTLTNAVRMNFHDAPLNTVLNYLSKRMGFIVNEVTEVRGNVTIVSEQPVGTNEVIDLLSSALAKNNYSVKREGRTLTISTTSDAKPEAPVKTAASAADIPINEEMATYILPVHTLNPTQLIKDLGELIPAGATVAANEQGNAILMTARQRDIHRFSEIINALDSSSVSDVEVYVLSYADAKSVAAELKEVFQSPDSSVSRSEARTRFGGRGFGGFGGFGGGGGDPAASSSSAESKNAANKAVFTSDDQMNAVIWAAPPDYFQMITNVILSLDKPSQDVTVIKTFHLKYADPMETADELGNLFPDDTKNNDQNNRSMGFRFNPFMQQPQTQSAGKSERMTRQTLVRAVPDPRTATLIVTASRQQMEQITQMIEDLDQNPAMAQSVHTFQLINADPITVQAALMAVFAGQSTKTQSSTQTTSPLIQRQTQAAQQQNSSSTSTFGSQGSGSTGLH